MRMARAQHVDGARVEIARPVGPRDHERARAIGHQAAVAHGQGIRNHLRAEHVVDRQGRAQEGVRIQLRPLARRHRHLGQLPPRGAVLVHMARGRQGVAGHRVERFVGVLVGLRVQRGPHLIDLRAAGRAARVGAVADQHVLALAGLDGHRRDLQVGNER
ncbi:hypothetical protein D9M68_586790 [compost metagenome]